MTQDQFIEISKQHQKLNGELRRENQMLNEICLSQAEEIKKLHEMKTELLTRLKETKFSFPDIKNIIEILENMK